MQSLDHLINLGYAATNYAISNQTYALQKDGQQSLAIGCLAAQRLYTLTQEVKENFPELKIRFLWVLPATLGVLAVGAPRLAALYLDSHPNPVTKREKLITAACKLLRLTGNISYTVLQHADKLINAAYLANAISLFHLKLPAQGSIALSGLFALALKRYSFLPVTVEQFINPISKLGAIATTIKTPMNIILKVITAAAQIFLLSDQVLNSRFVKSLLPESITNPFHNRHVIRSQPEPNDSLLDDTCSSWMFRVNTSHVHSEEVGKLLPIETDQNLDGIDASEQFHALNSQIEERGLVLTPEEWNGINNIRTCAITGRVSDVSPPDIVLFQKVLKAMVQSILTDNNDFERKMHELADLGNSCMEGWTRDASAMLSPETQQAAWAVHHVLAKMRGDILNLAIMHSNQNHGNPFDLIGGSNDVHTTNAFHRVLRHRYHTFQGELATQVYTPSVLNSLLIRGFDMHANTGEIGFFEGLYVGNILGEALPAISIDMGVASGGLCTSMIRDIMLDLNASYNRDAIVQVIYDAIKPEYHPSSTGNSMDQTRVIAWGAIQGWFADIADRRNIHVYDPETGESQLAWVQTDDYNQPYLTPAGVRLLLWDLGILERINNPEVFWL